MGFNPPVPQIDSDWEIRAALMLSLFFQVLLIVIGPSRKRTANPLPRFASWSCYLLADWVADLALGLLVNNLGNIGGNGPSSLLSVGGLTKGGGTATTASSGGSPAIFAFWTPFLLLHLGGQDSITAYSIEDNELWLRHLIGLIFQLFSACVVFSCSLHGNPMIPATVLMFVAGIIKYGERTYSLYSGSVNGVLANILPDPYPGPNYAKLMAVFSGKARAGLAVDIVRANGVARGLREDRDEVEVARQALYSNRTPELEAYGLYTVFRSLCYDINLGYKERRISQAFFLDRLDMDACRAVELAELELNFMFDMVHTKESVTHTLAGCVLRFISSACIIASAASFFRLDKGRIRHVDVNITYTLVLGALALDVAALAMLVFSNWTLVLLDKSSSALLRRLARLIRAVCPKLRRWSEMTPQLNLISYCLGKLDGGEALGTAVGPRLWRSPRAVRAIGKAAHMLGTREIFDDLFFVRREPLRMRDAVKDGKDYILFEFIFDELKNAAQDVRKSTVVADKEAWRSADAANAYRKSRYKDVEEMKKACSYRGERALNVTKKRISQGSMGGDDKQGVGSDSVNWYVLLDSVIDRDFDESLLMWHIATDLCFLVSGGSRSGMAGPAKDDRFKSVSKTLSEYMLYLLVKQPKILAASAGVGQMAYQDTCAEARRFFTSATMWHPDHEDARRMLLGTNTSVPPEVVKGGRSKSVLFDACIIAKELRKLDEEVMWEVVVRVWMEMLTYAAGKCKGTTHVHQLAHGGELITVVWLLMAHLGIGNVYQKVAEDDATPKLIITGQ